MSTDNEEPVIRPEAATTEPIPAAIDEPAANEPVAAEPMAAEPATVAPGQPVTRGYAAAPGYAAPGYAAAPAPARQRLVPGRAPWWHYVAVGVVGIMIGALLTAGFIGVASHFRNDGFGARRVQIQKMHRPGGFGPRRFGPNQGPGPGFNGPQRVQPSQVPNPAPTATG